MKACKNSKIVHQNSIHKKVGKFCFITWSTKIQLANIFTFGKILKVQVIFLRFNVICFFFSTEIGDSGSCYWKLLTLLCLTILKINKKGISKLWYVHVFCLYYGTAKRTQRLWGIGAFFTRAQHSQHMDKQ